MFFRTWLKASFNFLKACIRRQISRLFGEEQACAQNEIEKRAEKGVQRRADTTRAEDQRKGPEKRKRTTSKGQDCERNQVREAVTEHQEAQREWQQAQQKERKRAASHECASKSSFGKNTKIRIKIICKIQFKILNYT